jgi:sporulation protein YlmC with PRC-barrel domain
MATEVTKGSITGEVIQEVICNPPYMRYGLECCLDANNNTICDRDEVLEIPKEENKTKGDGNTGEEIPKEESQFLSNIESGISNIGKFFSSIGKSISQNKNYLFAGFGILIVLVVMIVLIKVILKRKPKETNRLKSIIGKGVYAENGDKIGKVKEVYLENYKIYGWLIKLDKKIAKKIMKKKILIKHKYVKSIGKIMIIEEKVAEHLDKFNSGQGST